MELVQVTCSLSAALKLEDACNSRQMDGGGQVAPATLASGRCGPWCIQSVLSPLLQGTDLCAWLVMNRRSRMGW